MEELFSQSSDRLTDMTTNPPEGKPDGIYKYPGVDAYYKKQNGKWYKKIGDSDYTELTQGNVDERIKQLELNATPLNPDKKIKSIVKKALDSELNNENIATYDYEGNLVVPQYKTIGKDTDYSKYQKINGEWYSGNGDIFTDYPGKEGKAYRYNDGKWYEYLSTISGDKGDISELKKPIKDPLRIDALNKRYKKQGGPEKGVFVGYPGKEENQYKIQGDKWLRKTPESDTWVTVTNEGSINALNNYFKKDISKIDSESEISKLKIDNNYSLLFNNNIKNINANFIGNEEEEVVSKLKKMFPSKYGWNFEESSAGDRVTVTAPNGKTEEFILDNWTWDDDKLNANNMIGWMQANNLNPSEKEAFDKYKSATDLPDRQVKFTHGGEIDVTPIKFYQTESEKKSINDWMPIKAKKVADIYDMYSEYIDTNGEGLNKGEIQRARAALGALSNDKQEIKQINNYQNDIKNNIKSYKEKINQTEDYLNLINEKYKNGEISYEEYKSIYSSQQEELINQQKEINNKIKTSDLLVRSSNRAVAENALAQEVMGSLGGGLALSAIKGFFSPVRLLLGATGSDMSSKEYHKFITDIISPVWNFKTSLEYLRSQENPDLYQAGFSVAESLGAMAPIALTGGSTLLGESILAKGTMGAVSFYPMSYYEMKDELENVKIPEEDKIALASIYGVVSSALESIGMEYAMGKVNTSIGSAIKRNILKNVLSKTIPANAPKEYIDALVRTETKAYISSLGLDLMGASGVEGLTEGLQSMTGAGINELYDIANKTNFFNKKGFEGVVKNALSESYLGAIGGGMVHSVYIASDAINRNIAINSETMRLLMLASKTNGMTDALMTNLKTDLLNGRITKEEAEEISNNFNIIKGNLNQIPDNLTEEAKSVSLSLMLERDKLNKEIEGKDPNLVKPQSDRITEINNRLQELSKENAVQEPSTEGVLPRQPETTGETGGEREGMGQGVQGEEVAQEGVEQAPIESKVQEIIPGEKATVADVDIVYPTEPQAEERKAFRSTSEYVENVSKELPIEDVETLTKELDGDFGLLTAENPMAQPLTEEENKQLNQKAEEWLNKKGYKPRRVTGKYGQAENSFFVPNLTRQDAIEFAKQFNQESVAHSDGLVYQDGSMNPRVKANDNLSFTESYNPESDFVSVVNTKDGLKTFSIGYNFDEKVMPEQQAATQISEVTITPETSQTVTERINKETDTKRKKVFTAVQKVLSAIPNAKIILHDNTDAFVSGVAKSAGITNNEAISQGVNNNRGSYVNGDIHINLEKAGVTTVFHEAFHDLLAKKGIETNAILDMAKGLKSVISDKALKTRLDDFVSNYEQGERAEEYTTELGAIMAEAQKELSTTKFQQFKTLVNKIAKKLGLPVVFSAASTAQDAVDFMNSMAGKLGKGEQIEVGNAIKVDTNELSIKAEKIGDFDVSYFEDADDYKKLVENGSVENNYDINKIAGEVVAIHQPDNMFVGDLNYKGKNIFKGLGGVFYTLITGNVWASGAEKSAKNLANLINKSLKESTDGIGRLVLVRGSESKMISSTEGVKAAMSIIELLVDKGLINRSEFRSSLIRAGKKFNIDFSGKDSSAAIHKDIKEKFMDVKNSTFQKRGDFFDEVINDLSKTSKSASENKAEIRKVLGSKKQIAFSKDGIRDSIGYILTERLLQDLPPSHVYAIIEVTEPVTYEERKGHDSYPWVLKSKSKPKLKLLSDRGNAVKDGVFEMIDGSEVSFGKLGLAQAGIGIAKISQQPSKIKAQKNVVLESKGLSNNSIKTIEDNYESDFGFYDFNWNKESERNNFQEWLNNFESNQFDKNLSKVINLVKQDIDLLNERKIIEEKLNAFEELIIPAIGDDVLTKKLSLFEQQILMDPNATIESIEKGFKEAKNIFDKDGNIDKLKITSSNLFEGGEISLPLFEKFIEKNPEYKNVFDDWKKIFDRNTELILKKTNASGYNFNIKKLENLYNELNNIQSKSKIKAQKLAPNGKPSNLNDVQWEQVRTPAFKKWFGDWENDPANASKVVDENGEPLVVYHGTYLYKGYYTEFNNISYFTDNKNTAEKYPIDSYIFYKKFDEYFDDFGLDENDINKLKKYGYDVEKLKSGNIMVREDDWSAIWKDYDPSKLFVYECFLNLRNPQIIENAEDFDITYITDSSDKRIENAKFENYDSIIGIYPYKWFSQDKINYHRGIIGDFKKEKHFVTFNSNQIKLADGTNTTFDAKNPSIKAQKQSKEDAIQDAKDKYELSVEKRGKDHKTGVTAAIADLQKSDWYRDADDIQREEAVREIKNFFGEKIKSAPSVAKVTGKTKQTAFVSDLAAAIRDQIKIQARSSRETAKNINDRRKALGTAIKEVVSKYKGKITERQLKSINTRIANVNLFNQEMVERVIDYVNKVMNNAEYDTKVNNAFAERRAIRRMMKSGNMAETVAVAKEFTQIDPSMVDDIDAYLEMAQKIRGAVKSSRRVGETVSLKQIVNFGEAYEYIKPVLDAQEESMKNMLLAEHNDLVESGVISKDMTLKDINKILNKIRLDEKVDSNEEESAREFLKQRLESIKSIVSIVAKGYNPLTGEVMEISDRNKQMIAKVVKSDMNNMSTKQMTEMVDSLFNFIENGAVGGIEAAYSTYVGEENAASLEKQGVVAKRLKLYLNPELGQLHGEEVTPLVELFNRMFLGVTKGIDVMTKSGFADVILGANKARRQVKEIQDNYVKKFGKIKNFFQIENVYERGAIAFLKRNLIGSDIEVKSEFNRRVDWLFESAERLKNGTQREQKMAEVYSKVFDKLDVKSRDLNKIISKANPTNVAAVDWWINEWSTHYSDLSDISRSVYNTILGKDINYTPDRLKTTSEGSSQTINDKILESKSAFLMNTDAITDTNESGVMIASVRPKIENTKGRYVSLDFDVNNIESLTGALVDINTAGAIRQVSSFFGSKSFKSIVPSAEDRTMLNERVNKYIRRAKNKLSVSSDFFNWMDQKTNIVASLSTAFGLGGIFQAPKQTISVALSTLLQTKTNFNVYAGESFNKWLNTTGATVSNRGQESRTELESANKKLQSFNGTLSQAIHEIKKLSQWQLKLFLSMPDVFVARAAFKSYYEQYLTKNGYDVSKINWDTWNDTIKKEGIEELNKKAIIYADAMTSRQQNVSDERLAGEFLANEDAARKTIRKMFLPFGSFSINQRARFVADINTLVRFNISSKEDIAIAINSIAGTMVEQIIFQAQNLGIGMLLYSIAQSLAGHDDDDDEWKKRIVNATKYPLRSLFADFVSPNPILDEPIILGADQLLGMMDAPSDGEIKQAIEDEQELRIATGKKPMTESQINKFKEEYIKENTYQLSYNFTNEDEGKYGLYSMSFDTYRKLYKNYELANNGTFIKENYGKETTMYLTDKDKSLAKYVYYILEVPYATGKALKEMGQVANKTYSIIKKRALTEDQYEVYKEFKKEFKREPQEWEINMIKSSKSPKYSFGAMRYVQDFGGLSNQQGKEYAKVFEKTGMVLPPAVFDMIKQGKSSDKAFQKYKQEMKKELNTDVSDRVFN